MTEIKENVIEGFVTEAVIANAGVDRYQMNRTIRTLVNRVIKDTFGFNTRSPKSLLN